MRSVAVTIAAVLVVLLPRLSSAIPCSPPASSAGLSAVEQSQFTGQVAVINAPSPTPAFTGTIDWGDGSSSAVSSVTGNECGGYLVHGTHTYAAGGSYPLTISLTDQNNAATQSASGIAIVDDNDGYSPSPSPPTFSAREAVLFSGTVATLLDTNQSTPASSLVTTIDWGDGSSSPGSASGSNGLFTVSGSHNYQGPALGWISDTTSVPAMVSVGELLSGAAVSPPPAGLALWLKADSGVTTDGSNNVTSWADSSGNSNNATPPAVDPSSPPTAPLLVASALNGKPVVRFNGSSNYLETANNMPGGARPYAIFVVANPTGTGSRGFIGWGSFGSQSEVVAFRQDSLSALDIYWWANDLYATTIITGQALFETTFDGSTRQILRNGLVVGSSPSSGKNTTATPAGIGVTDLNLSELMQGDIAEILVYDAALSPTTQRAVEAYLQEKYSLPADHAEIPINGTVASEFHVTQFLTGFPEHAPVGLVATFTDSVTSHTAADLQAFVFFCEGRDEAPIITGGSGSFSVWSSYSTPLSAGQSDCVDEIDIELVNASWGDYDGSDRLPIVDAPLSGTSRSFQAAPTVQWSGEVASFFDPDTRSTAGGFTSASIDWGDGTTPDAGTIIYSGVTGFYSVVGKHTYAAASATPLVVTVKVTDGGGATVTILSSAIVIDSIINVIGTDNLVGVSVSSSILAASFSVKDLTSAAGDFTATIDWGDGSTASSGQIVGARGVFDVDGTHTYASSGSFTTVITVVDTRAAGGTGTGSGKSTVNDSLIAFAVPSSIEETVGVQFSLGGMLTDQQAGAVASKYQITVKWGDGSTDSTANVTAQSGGGFLVSANHTYAAVGMDTIGITIADSAGGTLANFSITANVVAAPSADGGSTTSGHSSSGGCSASGAGSTSSGALGLFALLLLVAFSRRRWA